MSAIADGRVSGPGGRPATALVNPFVGIATGSLVAMWAHAACRWPQPPPGPSVPPPCGPARAEENV